MKLTSWGQFPPLVRKAWRVMRITTLLILVISLHLSAKTTAQKITLVSNNISIEQFFNQLEKQTGYSFLLENGVVSKDEKISVNVKEATLETVLDQILKPINLSYKIENKTVFIIKAAKTSVPDDGTLPPPIDIHGRVTDSLGNPLSGASVTVKGSKRGTSTNVNGEFILHGVNEDATLIISFTGYTSKNIKLNGSASIDISLVHSNSPLDQVQIIAYGTTTKRLSTGDVTTVTSEEIGMQPVTNPLFALDGRVPGLYIQQATGLPTSGYTVKIRGLNSIAAGTSPLYIIDGIPYNQTSSSTTTGIGYGLTQNNDLMNPLNFLNPLDIQSIEVLKDADATAIYGSRGGNGVILITTKKGVAGRIKADVNISTGISQVGHYMQLLNTQQYVEMRDEAFANDKLTPTLSNAPDLLSWDTTKYTDWQRKLIGGTAHNTNAQISLSGGNKNTQFLVSGDYLKNGTVFPGDFSQQRASGNMSLNTISENQKFKASIKVNYLNENDNLPIFDPTGSVTMPPNTPDLLDSKGNIIWPPFVRDNPYADLLNKYKIISNNFIASAALRYEIVKDLEIVADLGFGSTDVQETTTSPIASNNPSFGITTGSSVFGNNRNQNWNIEPQLNWKKQTNFGKFNVLIGTTFQQNLQQGSLVNANGYTNDALLEDINSAGSLTSGGSTDIQYRYTAGFARISYNYDDRYLINLTGRRDGSSRFGPGNQFANFGSVGAGWIFSNESFLKQGLPVLSFGKLRGSYGITGNDQIPDYGYQQLFSSVGYPFQSQPTIYPVNLANPNYGWEKNKKLEIGIDLGFLQDRILFSASWYKNETNNQLVGYPLPASTGYTSIQGNLPAVIQNTGVEMTLNTINIKSSSFAWYSSFNISIPRNKLVSYPGIENSSYANTYTVGKPLYMTQTLTNNGLDSLGRYMFLDVDHSGGLSIPGDFQSTVQIAQNFYGGLSNTLTYKGFQLDFLFQFVQQTGHNPLFFTGPFAPGMQANQLTGVLSRWQKPGDITDVEKFTTGQGAGFQTYLPWIFSQAFGSIAVSDASFIRLKNASLSYSLPQSILKKIKIEQAKIYIQGQNLLTITSYKSLDPESQTGGGLPPLRTIMAGIQITL